jgi:hypothetical protein
MAQGRMLNRKISLNKDLPRLMQVVDQRMGTPHGAQAVVLYTWCISHLDVEGRMHGDPIVVKGTVVPRFPSITDAHIEPYLVAMADIGLVHYYEADGDRWLSFPAFEDAQPGLRKDREAPSKIPPPEAGSPVRGHAPEEVRSNSGVGPAEEKRREDQEKEKRTQDAHARVGGTKKAWQQKWATATGVLHPDAYSLDQAHRLIARYAVDANRPLADVEDSALVAYGTHVASWSNPQPLTPQLFVAKWDAVQAVMAGRVPRAPPPKRNGKFRDAMDPVAETKEYDLGEVLGRPAGASSAGNRNDG